MNINRSYFQNIIQFLIYFFPISFILSTGAVNLNVLLIIIVSSVYFFIFKINLKINNIIFAIIVLTIYICILSLFKTFSINSENSNQIIRGITHLRYGFFAFFLYNIFLNINFDYKKLIFTYSFIILIIIIDLIFQYIFGFNFIGIKPHLQKNILYYNSFFFDEKIAGGYILNFFFFLVVGVKFFLKNIRYSNIILILILALGIISIFLSQNRMSLLLSIFGLMVFGFLNRKYFNSIIFSFLIFICFLFMFPNNDIKQNYEDMIKNIRAIPLKSKLFSNYLDGVPLSEIKKEYPKTHKTENSLYHTIGSGHAQIYVKSFLIFKDNFIFGTGLKGYHKACTKINKDLNVKYDAGWCSTHPHNYYLDIAVISGLIGISIIFFIITLILIKFLNLNILKKKSLKLDETFYLILLINILLIFFPFRSSGSFFTSTNLSYIIFNLSLISFFQEKLKK